MFDKLFKKAEKPEVKAEENVEEIIVEETSVEA